MKLNKVNLLLSQKIFRVFFPPQNVGAVGGALISAFKPIKLYYVVHFVATLSYLGYLEAVVWNKGQNK